MSGIKTRTIYCERDRLDGKFRFADWATVTTVIGTMYEPFCMYARQGVNNDLCPFEWDDMIARIDEIHSMPLERANNWHTDGVITAGDRTIITGGLSLPRSGR